MEQIMNYVKPELIVVAVVLYFLGQAIKKSQTIKDKYIPSSMGLWALCCVVYTFWAQVATRPGRKLLWRYLRPLRRVFWLPD